MRKIIVPVVLLLLVLACGWLALGGPGPQPVETAAARVASANSRTVEAGRGPAEDGRGEASRAREAGKQERRAAARKEREALRSRIVAALERRAADGAAHAEEAGGARDGKSAAAPGEDEAAPHALVDQTGEHGYLMKVANEELMPLAGECEALAREAKPELTGMLVLDFEILADEDIGGVVEAVAPGQLNEVDDAGLIECMRESILAVSLPPPPQGGRDAVSLSIPIGPES